MLGKKDVVKKEHQVEKSSAERTREKRAYTPPVDIYELKDAYYVIADVPGADPEKIDISVEENILRIEAPVKLPEWEGYKPIYQEFIEGDYVRSFSLPEEIEEEKIEARFKDGVLHIKLPKEEKKKVKIQVQK